MDRRNSKKSHGRITINQEASDKIRALFSQESDTSLEFSAAEHTANEKGETTDHATSSTSTSETNVTNTCAGVVSLPKIVNTPPPSNHGNEAEKKDAGSGVKRSSPPPIKLPLLPTHQIRQPPKRIQSSLRRTPANANAAKPSEIRFPPVPIKPQLIPTQQSPRIRSSVRRTLPSNSNAAKQPAPPPMKPPAAPTTPPRQPERIGSASLRRKATFITPPTTDDDPHYSDDFDEEDEDDKDDDRNDDGDVDSDTTSSDDADDTPMISKRPVTGVTRRVGDTFNGRVFPPCVLPRYQRRSTFPLFTGQAVIAPGLMQTRSMPALTESITIEKEQIPVTVSAGVLPDVIGLRKKKRELTNSQLIQKMTSQYALTPLKMKANDLVTVHYDIYPTEIFPGLNRSPSFIGTKDEDDGLMSGRCSPKLDIPRRRYCGRMIHQHPLVKFCYRMNDRRLAHLIKKQISSSSTSSSSSSSSSSSYGYLKMFTKQLAQKNPIRKPLPFMKPSGYLEIYKRKVSFSKKKVLPPIGCKPTEDKQPALVLLPTPPSQPPPTDDQSAAMRSTRKARTERRQQKNKISGIGKKQKQC